jgi:hypothetical protein
MSRAVRGIATGSLLLTAFGWASVPSHSVPGRSQAHTRVNLATENRRPARRVGVPHACAVAGTGFEYDRGAPPAATLDVEPAPAGNRDAAGKIAGCRPMSQHPAPLGPVGFLGAHRKWHRRGQRHQSERRSE